MDTTPHVQFPRVREAPAHVVRGLRAVDPMADLLYVGEGQWVLGVVRPNRITHAQAVRTLDSVTQTLSTGARHTAETRGAVWTAELALQGFRPVALYTTPEPTEAIVRDFQRADFLYREAADRHFRAVLHAREHAADRARADALAEFRGSAGEARREAARLIPQFAVTRSHSGA